MMGRSGTATLPPVLPGELEQVVAMMSILNLAADPKRLQAGVKALSDAAMAYAEIKAAADEAMAQVEVGEKRIDEENTALKEREIRVREREGEVDATARARETEVKKREDAIAVRESKLKAAMA